MCCGHQMRPTLEHCLHRLRVRCQMHFCWHWTELLVQLRSRNKLPVSTMGHGSRGRTLVWLGSSSGAKHMAPAASGKWSSEETDRGPSWSCKYQIAHCAWCPRKNKYRCPHLPRIIDSVCLGKNYMAVFMANCKKVFLFLIYPRITQSPSK